MSANLTGIAVLDNIEFALPLNFQMLHDEQPMSFMIWEL